MMLEKVIKKNDDVKDRQVTAVKKWINEENKRKYLLLIAMERGVC